MKNSKYYLEATDVQDKVFNEENRQKPKFKIGDKVKADIDVGGSHTGIVDEVKWITDTSRLPGEYEVSKVKKMLPTYLYWMKQSGGDEFWSLEPQLKKIK